MDADQRAFGYENLLVCDGSAIPANMGVNPSPDDHRAGRARHEPGSGGDHPVSTRLELTQSALVLPASASVIAHGVTGDVDGLLMRASDLTTHVDIRLVCLSLAVAVIASYGALDLAQRSGEAAGSHRRLWIGSAGVTMGLGIWSMHFIGMLALKMQMPVSYNLTLVMLSLVAAVLGACVSLATVARPQVSRWGVLSAGAFMGFAVAAMHYLGMASMQMAAVIHWNIALVIASVAIGFVASLFALWLIVHIRLSADGFGLSRRLLAAVLLGLGVAGLHYIAMAASTFRPTAAVGHHNGLDTSSLVMMLTLGAGIMLAALIGGAGLDQRRAALAKDIALIAELARQLSRIGNARDRVCQAIQELTGADFAVLVEPVGGGRESVRPWGSSRA